MNLNRTKPLVAACIVVLCNFLLMIDNARAQDKRDIQPLFQIEIPHELPQPEKTFNEIRDLILNNYYSDKISDEALYWSAIKGMLRHISPPENPDLAKIWTPEEYENVLLTLQGEQISFGIKSSFNAAEGSLTVSEVIPGSPSDGVLQPMDRILRINSEKLKNRSVADINSLLKGEEGEEITLTINRDIEVFDVTIIRKKFNTPNLIITGLTEEVLLVDLRSFSADISKDLKKELAKYSEKRFKSIIIDLRNNSGGVFAEALRVIELFLPEKSILLRTMQRDTGLQNYVSSNKNPFEFDIAILMNEKTASSAEILAAALQEHRKALLIGSGTYGKGVFDRIYTLENNFRVRFITGAMYSPRGKTWQGKGLIPDFLVNQNEDTLKALMKLTPEERFRKDVGIITAYKLLDRDLD
ncbi:S41 family peptidase [Thermodesulfobacteriota bacterium]